jgi:hypothetical protein
VKRSLRRIVHRLGFTVPLWLMGCGLGPSEVAEDASCSPNADLWLGAELAKVCKGLTLSECPEADSIGEDYELRAERECQ